MYGHDLDGTIDFSFALEKPPQKAITIMPLILIHKSTNNYVYSAYEFRSGPASPLARA
jgi:hypothetical protein